MQAYLAAAQTTEGLPQDADLDWSDTERIGFVLRNPIGALAPSNDGPQPGGAEGGDRYHVRGGTAALWYASGPHRAYRTSGKPD
jgi:hypothetical protein